MDEFLATLGLGALSKHRVNWMVEFIIPSDECDAGATAQGGDQETRADAALQRFTSVPVG